MEKPRPNIIFVMLDTARADYFKTYGGGTPLPNMDRLCDAGTVYGNAISPATYTAPSHVSLFTGEGVKNRKQLMEDKLKNYDKNIDPMLVKSKLIAHGEMTLARKLSYLGYDTSMFSSNPLVTEYNGLAEGFAHSYYTSNVVLSSRQKMKKGRIGRPLWMIGNDMLRNGLIEIAYGITRMMPRNTLDKTYLDMRNRLNRSYAEESGFYDLDLGARETGGLVEKNVKKGNSPNFVFINYMEAHEGYPTNLITKEYVEQDKWLYLSGIAEHENTMPILKKACMKRMRYLDWHIGRLVRTLRDKGMLDDAVMVLAGDHGQGFMEHGELYHGAAPYREIVNVPLVFTRFENGKPVQDKRRIERHVSLTEAHRALEAIAYGETYEKALGSMLGGKPVVAEHTGITEVWDTHLLKLIRGRCSHADRIYRAKMKHNTFATAIYKDGYKLVHFAGKGSGDLLFHVADDPGEEENVIEKERKTALRLLGSI